MESKRSFCRQKTTVCGVPEPGHCYTIRPYKTADAVWIEKLFLMLDIYSCEILPDKLKKFEETEDLKKAACSFIKRKRVKGKNQKTFVAETSEGCVAGFISGSVATEYPGFRISVYGEVDVFFVDEKLRGRGVGRSLYRAMEEWFRAKECQAVRINTWKTNYPAAAAYRSMGFDEISVIFVKELNYNRQPPPQGGAYLQSQE